MKALVGAFEFGRVCARAAYQLRRHPDRRIFHVLHRIHPVEGAVRLNQRLGLVVGISMKSRSPSRDSAVSANSWRLLRGQAKLTALNDMFWAYEAEVLISSTCDRVDDWIIILSTPSGVLLIQCRRASLTGEKCARMLYTQCKLRCHLMPNA